MPTMHITLPCLHMLIYCGGSMYLKGILTCLDVPHLHTLNIEFFYQLTFSIPFLLHFTHIMNTLTFCSAALYFNKDFASFIINLLNKCTSDGGGSTHPLHIQVKGKLLNWQVTSTCLCGDIAKMNEEGSIQCQKVGCKTVWVSSHSHDQPIMCFDLLANSIYSITFSILGTRMHVHKAGPVMHVH